MSNSTSFQQTQRDLTATQAFLVRRALSQGLTAGTSRWAPAQPGPWEWSQSRHTNADRPPPRRACGMWASAMVNTGRAILQRFGPFYGWARESRGSGCSWTGTRAKSFSQTRAVILVCMCLNTRSLREYSLTFIITVCNIRWGSYQ